MSVVYMLLSRSLPSDGSTYHNTLCNEPNTSFCSKVRKNAACHKTEHHTFSDSVNVCFNVSLTDWLINSCWSSPAQSFFVPSPAGRYSISDVFGRKSEHRATIYNVAVRESINAPNSIERSRQSLSYSRIFYGDECSTLKLAHMTGTSTWRHHHPSWWGQKQPPKRRTPAPYWHSWATEMTSLHTNNKFPCDTGRKCVRQYTLHCCIKPDTYWRELGQSVRHSWNCNILPGGKAGKNKGCFRATWNITSSNLTISSPHDSNQYLIRQVFIN
jgi:hypothetical protein